METGVADGATAGGKAPGGKGPGGKGPGGRSAKNGGETDGGEALPEAARGAAQGLPGPPGRGRERDLSMLCLVAAASAGPVAL